MRARCHLPLEHIEVDIRGTSIPLNIARPKGLTSSLRASASYDTRNNRLFPSSGTYTNFSVEYAHVRSELENGLDGEQNRLHFSVLYRF